jgi:hypothetical protein
MQTETAAKKEGEEAQIAPFRKSPPKTVYLLKKGLEHTLKQKITLN